METNYFKYLFEVQVEFVVTWVPQPRLSLAHTIIVTLTCIYDEFYRFYLLGYPRYTHCICICYVYMYVYCCYVYLNKHLSIYLWPLP